MTCRIILQPLEPFFFGGERTFGVRGDERNGSYIAHSEKWPQPSAVLGMLRKELMIQNGLLTRKIRGEWVDVDKKEEAKKLVGSEKFDPTRDDEQDFGAVKRISALYIYDTKESRAFASRIDMNGLELDLNAAAPLLRGYNPKKNIYGKLIACDDSGEILSEDSLFHSVERVGNQKGGDQDAFYKKIAYRLERNFAFAFDLRLELPSDIKETFTFKPGIVPLGADGSRFKMEIEQIENSDTFGPAFKEENGQTTLLSDCYLTEPLETMCRFAVTHEVAHASLQHFKHANPDKSKPFKKSKKLYFYGKGSIFFEPTDSFFKALEHPNLQKIGYNQINRNQGERA